MEDTDQEHTNKKLVFPLENGSKECVGDVCEITPTLDQEAPANIKEKKNKKTGSSSSFIKTLHSQQELSTMLDSNEAVVVEFLASWCGACAGIEPLYEELAAAATESNGLQAAQIICDKNKETKKLAATFGVRSYPVFVVFENGNESGRWNGADRGKLEKVFDRLGGGGGGRGGNRKKKKGKGRK